MHVVNLSSVDRKEEFMCVNHVFSQEKNACTPDRAAGEEGWSSPRDRTAGLVPCSWESSSEVKYK